jgi:peptidoglycan/LPS O-acetylase OafA/YrhL
MTGTAQTSRDKDTARSDFIQAMRFFAAAVVLITHVTFYFHERLSAAMAVWHGGEIGVPIFFVISGIVIVMSSAALPRNALGAGKFMSRRLLRIVPLYWVVTAIKVAIALALPATVLHNHFDVVYALKSFFFIPAFNDAGEVRPIHGVGWTLLHEMFFYVTFSLAMLLRAPAVVTVTALIVSLSAWGYWQAAAAPFGIVVTHSINLCFVAGMWVGLAILDGGMATRRGRVTLGALLLLAAVSALWPSGVMPLLPQASVLALAAAMLWLCRWSMPAMTRPLVALGASSYALYLFHPMMAPAALLSLHKLVPGLAAELKIVLTVLVVIGAAHLVHLFIEEPLGRWARRFFIERPVWKKGMAG